MQNPKFTVERITRENYHMFDDMVSWRMTGIESTEEEKKANKSNEFTEVYSDLEHPGFYAYGALCDGRFVGWISIIYTPKIGRRRWKKGVIYVDELWVAPNIAEVASADSFCKKHSIARKRRRPSKSGFMSAKTIQQRRICINRADCERWGRRYI